MFGIDSATPVSLEYPYGKPEVQGIYVAGDTPYIWTHADVENLPATCKYFYPLVVPPTTWPWPGGVTGTLGSLISNAINWGIAPYCPIVLDIEETTVQQAGDLLGTIIGNWQNICRKLSRLDGIYGGDQVQAIVGTTSKFILAQWFNEAPPQLPKLPEGLYGWQFYGDYGTIPNAADLEVMSNTEVYISCRTFKPVDLSKRQGPDMIYGLINLSGDNGKPSKMADYYYLFASGKCEPVATPGDESEAIARAAWVSSKFSVKQVEEWVAAE